MPEICHFNGNIFPIIEMRNFEGRLPNERYLAVVNIGGKDWELPSTEYKSCTIFKCDQCHQEKTHFSDFTTGYGVYDDERKVCFSCCGKNDAKQLAELPIGGKMVLYLTSQINEERANLNPYGYRGENYREAYREHFVSNWPNTLKIKVHWPVKGKHNIARTRYSVRFTYAGNHYSGIQYGDFTQICHIRRVKPA